MSRKTNFKMYGGGGGKNPKKRQSGGFNVREEYIKSLHAGASRPFQDVSAMESRAGAPPWTNRSPTGTVSNYLQDEINSLMSTGNRKQMTSDKRGRGNTSDFVLDPDDMIHQIFQLKKELLASENEKTLLKTQVRRLDQEVAQCRNMDLQDDKLATLVKNSSLVAGLKKVIHELRRDLDASRKEASEFRQSIKYTNIRDLMIEKDAYYEEVLRLQIQLQDDSDSDEEAGHMHAPSELSVTKADTKYIKPSVQTMQTLKKECEALKLENTGLLADLDKALTAAYKVREDLDAPETSAGNAEKYAGLSEDQLVAKLVDLEVKSNRIQSENKAILKRAQTLEEGEKGMLARLGLRDDKEPNELRSQVTHLKRLVEDLEAERDESIQQQASMPLHALDSIQMHNSQNASATIPMSIVFGDSAGTRVNAGTSIILPNDSVSQVGSTPPYRTQASTTVQPSPLRLQPEINDINEEPISDNGSRIPTYEPPTVHNSKDAGHNKVAKDRAAADKRRREASMKKNKEIVDAKIGIIQKAIRGHVARRRIVKRLETGSQEQTNSSPTPREEHRKRDRSSLAPPPIKVGSPLLHRKSPPGSPLTPRKSPGSPLVRGLASRPTTAGSTRSSRSAKNSPRPTSAYSDDFDSVDDEVDTPIAEDSDDSF